MRLLEERSPVDTLEHLAFLVASPVRSRSRKELEVLEAARRRHVRATAEVEERSVLIDRDDLILRELVQALQLQRIVREELTSLFQAHDAPLEGMVRLRDLRHFGLESFEVSGRERFWDIEVVVEAVVDGGAESDAGTGAELPHGRREHVSGGVTEHSQCVLVALGQNTDRGLPRKTGTEIHRLAVDLPRDRSLGKAGTDRGGHVTEGGIRGDFEDRPVREGHLDHGGGHRRPSSASGKKSAGPLPYRWDEIGSNWGSYWFSRVGKRARVGSAFMVEGV